MQNEKQSASRTAGWIVWWIHLVLLLIGTGILVYLVSHPQYLSAARLLGKLEVAIFAGPVLAFHFGVQLLSYFAIQRLNQNDNYLWPIVLIMVGFMGSFLYLIPGIWGLSVNSNNRVDRVNRV